MPDPDVVTAAAEIATQGAPVESPETFDRQADIAEAIKLMGAAKPAATDAPAQVEQPKVEAAQEKPTEPAKPAAEPPADEDAKMARVFNRISRLEDELATARREAEQNRADADRGRKREEAFKKFKEDPKALFDEVGWDHETIRDFVINGPKATKVEQAGLTREQQTLADEVKALKAQLESERHGQQMAAAKARIPELLKPEADKYPTMFTYFESPTEMAETLFGVMAQAQQDQKTVSLSDAAASVEKVLADQAKRFSRARSETQESSTPAPASKPATPTLTTIPSGSVTPPSKSLDDMTDAERMAAAIATMRPARK